jgi:ribonucleotide reductase alpha subunit
MYKYEQVYKEALAYFKGDDAVARIWISKYCLKDQQGNYYELTPDDMHHRLAKEFSRIESKYPKSINEQIVFDLLKDFKYIVPQGSPMAGIGNSFVMTSLSNCFVIDSPHDSYAGIFYSEQEMVSIMKRRGGVGLSIHSLRPKDMPTTSVSEKSSGLVLFSERYSNATREVAQDGRRGALMLSCRVTHPDILHMISAKVNTQKITGANVSIMINDEFMEAVKNDTDYEVFFESPKGNIRHKLNARVVWTQIVTNAWKSAEPGILFWDTVLRESPADCYVEEGYRTIGTNPCFVGNTIVAVADGRNGVKIKDLAEANEPFLVYSARNNKSSGNHGGAWKAEIKMAKAFKTGIRKVLQIFLSDRSSFQCTPDHLLATSCGTYVEAKDSLGCQLGKFYSFSNKNSGQHYRSINSKTNGTAKQYRMLWSHINGNYDGSLFNVDHINGDSTDDSINNLRLLSIEEHRAVTKRFGDDNPIKKIVGTTRHQLMNKRKNILANASRYEWGKDRLDSLLKEFDDKYSDTLLSLEPENLNVYLDEGVFVEYIAEGAEEEVYDLTVEDNHNFYIITNTDDDRFLNSSGVLVHNCGELPLCAQDSCRLMVLNLYSYIENPFTSRATFDVDLFKQHVNIAQRLMDDMVDLEIEKVDLIIDKIERDDDPEHLKFVERNLWKGIREKAVNGRRTGLGITAEGDMIAAMGLRYGSEEATKFAVKVHKILAIESYKASIEMAEERGCFPVWDLQKEKKNPFLNRIIGTTVKGDDNIDYTFPENWVKNYLKFGRRNIANLTISPAGTTSSMTNTTSGIEPCFLPIYKRRRKTHEKERSVFTDEKGDMWEEYKVVHPKFKIWYEVNWERLGTHNYPIEYMNDQEIEELVKKSPYHKACSNDVDWVAKIKMQGEIQKWIDHSISVTVNLPKETTVETVEKVYMAAYESGCKGCTVYRDGSRSGILISDKKEEESEIVYKKALVRPETLECDIFNKTVLGQDWTVLVGLLKGKPFEIFALSQLNQIDFPNEIKRGKIKCLKSGHYQLTGERNGKVYVIENVIPHLKDNESTGTRQYSTQLRYGIKPIEIVKQIDKYATITSFDKAISRVLKNYTNGEKSGDVCPICHSKLIFEDGCEKCPNGDFSKCG